MSSRVPRSESLEMDTLGADQPESERSSSKPIPSLVSREYTIGILLLLVVVFLWTSSNFVTQDLFEDGYEKPFLVTYLNTSAFSLYLIPVVVRYLLSSSSRWGKSSIESTPEEYQPLNATTLDEMETSASEDERYLGPEQSPLTVRETANLACIFCIFWFIANWSVNASLNFTSVASATILSSTSGLFTMGIGRLFQVESFTMRKIGAVVVSFVGVVLVSLSDSTPMAATPSHTNKSAAVATGEHASRPILGDGLALLSAVFYALYVILLKVRIRSESRIDMQLFFGFVGLCNAVSLWPLGFLLHITGVEPFQLPTTSKMVAALLVNMFITWLSDYLYVLSMLKTTPLVVTIGLSLTIPVAVAGDLVLGHLVKGQVLAGALLVLGSFVVVGTDHSNVGTVSEERPGQPNHEEL